MTEWTGAQTEVLTTGAENLIVSASAGSGKTTVMIARIAELKSFDDLLVLTFTNESARDMKWKLSKQLGEKFAPEIAQISIGTFHKFCGDLVQTYFSVLGINPSYSILDENQAHLIADEILDALIERRAGECAGAVLAFGNMYGVAGLKDVIKNIARFTEWQIDPEAWLRHAGAGADAARRVIADAPNPPTTPTPIDEIVAYYRGAGEWFKEKFAPESDLAMWSGRLRAVAGYDDLHKISREFTKLKPMKTDEPAYFAKNILNEMLKKIRDQYALAPDTIAKNEKADNDLIAQIVTLVREFNELYATEKTRRNYLDFADLERCALKLLNDPQTADRIHAKYKKIFVDEYQDTNPVQERILELLTAENSGCTLFTVGDVKQSIYGFRGTNAKIFVDRMGRDRVVYLNTNFRSRAGILDFANRVFGDIMRNATAGIDYNATSRLVSGLVHEKDTDENDVEVIVIEGGTSEQEAAIIAEKIVALHAQGVEFDSIAVLARSSTNFPILMSTLKRVGIRCMCDKKSPANELFEIEILNNFLLACADPAYELPVALTMQSFIFDFTPDDLARIKICGRDPKQVLSGALESRYNEFLATLNKYHDLSKTLTVAELLSRFLAEFNVIARLLVTPDGSGRVQNIYTFLNKLRGASYADTVAQYAFMMQNEMIDIELDVSQSGDAVRIMTIHSAKGLEFDNVFLYNAGANFSSADKRKSIIADRDFGLCVYSTDPDENKKHMSIRRLGSIIASNRTQIAEEMRLLYVAVTRAEKRLFIVGSGRAYEPKMLSDFEIMLSKNYFDFIRPTETISAQDIRVIEPKKEQQVLGGKPDPDVVKKLRTRFMYEYPHKGACDLPQKSSVTGLTKTERAYMDDTRTPATANLSAADHTRRAASAPAADRGTEYGTRFHNAMQMRTPFDVAGVRCLEIVDEFTHGLDVYREIAVLETINYAENGGEPEPRLVQGVIDLLAITPRVVTPKRAVIIDYKTNRATKTELLQMYTGQITMYAGAVERAFGVKPEMYLYSTAMEKLIRVD